MNVAIERKGSKQLEIVADLKSPEEVKAVILYKLRQEIDRTKGKVIDARFGLFTILIDDGPQMSIEAFIKLANRCGLTFFLVSDDVIREMAGSGAEGIDYREEPFKIEL